MRQALHILVRFLNADSPLCIVLTRAFDWIPSRTYRVHEAAHVLGRIEHQLAVDNER